MKKSSMLLFLLILMMIVASCSSYAKNEEEHISIKEDTFETLEIEKQITISMVGDMIFYGSVEQYMKKYGDEYVLEGYGPLMKKSHIVLGNLETPMSRKGTPMEDKQYTFRARPEILRVLKDNNFSAVSIANNHVLDFGMEAFLDTLEYLKKYGIFFSGGGKSREEAHKGIIIEKNDIKVGFLAFSKVVPSVDWYAEKEKPGIVGAYKVHEKEFVKAIQELKENCDVLVVSVHWGKEASIDIRDEERYIGHRMIDAGADIIMGHHPHVVQGIEIYKGKPIFYSLGNFIFTKSRFDMANKTIMANVTVDKEGNVKNIQVIPGNIVNGRPIPMDDIERNKFIKYLNELNINCILN